MKTETLYFEITNQCNLNCKTCYNRSGLNCVRKELSAKQVEGVIQTFLPYGLKRVLLSGGEPTLHTEFSSFLEFPDRYPQLEFGIVTNGTILREDFLNAINQKKFTLQVSLDGSDETSNARTRGTGNFQKTVNFLQKIHTPKVPIRLKCVLSQQNIDRLEDFFELALSLNCTPEFAYIYRSGNGDSEWEKKALSPHQKAQAYERIRRLNQRHGVSSFLPGCTDTCPFAAGNTEHLSMCIRTDGAIQPCQTFYGDEFTLANALSFDLEEFSRNLARLCRSAALRRTADYGCTPCPLRKVCGRGCPALAACLHGSMDASDGDCIFRQIRFFSDHREEVIKEHEKEN